MKKPHMKTLIPSAQFIYLWRDVAIFQHYGWVACSRHPAYDTHNEKTVKGRAKVISSIFSWPINVGKHISRLLNAAIVYCCKEMLNIIIVIQEGLWYLKNEWAWLIGMGNIRWHAWRRLCPSRQLNPVLKAMKFGWLQGLQWPTRMAVSNILCIFLCMWSGHTWSREPWEVGV